MSLFPVPLHAFVLLLEAPAYDPHGLEINGFLYKGGVYQIINIRKEVGVVPYNAAILVK